MWRSALVAVVLAAAVSAVALAQQAAPASTPVVQASPFVNLSRVSNDYRVGPGDVIEIRIVGHDDLGQTLRITNSGEISYPMVGLIPVAGKTVFETEDTVAARLCDAGLLQHPDVLVFITEYQAKPVYVSGAVVNPGQFVMSQEMNVSEAILLAGGLLFTASDEGLVHRRRHATPAAPQSDAAGAAPTVEIIKVDLTPIKEGRFLERALPLEPGDVLMVPEARMHPFYVAGDVVDPRNFAYAPGKTMTASQAISWAGGPTLTAKMSKGMLVRFDEQGRRTERKVDYSAILQGKQEDFLIQPNDIIFIPGSNAKTLAQGLIGLTDNMVMQASFRIARTYQLPGAPGGR